MKKTLLTNMLMKIATTTFLLLCVFTSYTNAQAVDCNTVTVSCNDLVTISLDDDCETTVEFDMVLEDPNKFASYLVVVEDDNGPIATSPNVTGANEGDTLKVKVTMIDCGITCWGNIIVRDTKDPIITACAPIVVDCDDSTPYVEPTATDNCSPVTWSYVDQPHGVMCDGGYCSTIDRVWTATDIAGNTATCTQEIRFNSVDVTTVVFPVDYILDYDVSTPCADLDVTGIDPAVSGAPTSYNCACLQFSYTDTPFEMCGAGTKMLRQWFVIDWCSGEYAEAGQNIEAFDDEPPALTCVETYFEVPTDPYSCKADYVVHLPEPTVGTTIYNPVYFDCSDVTYTIEYSVLPDEFNCTTVAEAQALSFDTSILTWIPVTPVGGVYTIQDLEPGCAWIRYQLTDACGNVTDYCTKDIVVVDGGNPIAIAEGFTQLTLDASCEVMMLAESLDDGSFDYCCDIVEYEIKRVGSHCTGFADDLNYGPSVTFCHADVGNQITVMLKVTDCAGNMDEAQGIVLIDDFDQVTVTCPNDDYDYTCSQFVNFNDPNHSTYADPTVTSTCADLGGGVVTMVKSFSESGDPGHTLDGLCGTGDIIRAVEVYVNGTLVETCYQTITISGDPATLTGITCPSAVNLISCAAGYTPEDLNSFATANTVGSCSNVVVSYVDGAPFEDVDASACYSILRTWTAIDWCVYDPDNPVDGIYTCTQQLNFVSSQGPTMLNCTNVTVADSDNDCQHYVELTVTSTDGDGCTPDALIQYTYEIDLDKDGTVDHSGNGNDASGTYPVGNHNITFTAKDACGMTESCTYMFMITNSGAPTPICRAELVWALGGDGTTEVWASDFNIKSESPCGQEGDLIFSFTADGNTQALAFSCADIPNGIGAEIALNMYVIDPSGQAEFCQVTLILQDNLDVCTDNTNRMAFVSGRVYDEFYTGVQDFEVALEDISDAEMYMEYTDQEGDYMFESVEYYDEYYVAPQRNDLHKEGVSTLDLVLIQRHILNLENLDSPFKLIAADANKNNSVTSADMVDIRKVILDEYSHFPSNNSWQFVDANHQFIDPMHPWDYQTAVNIPELYVDYANVEFVAVKTGDVNNSVNFFLHGDEVEARGHEDFALITKDQDFAEQDIVTIPLLAGADLDIYGMQFTLDFDPQVLAFNGITAGQLPVRADMISTAKANQGVITVSIDNALGQAIAKDVQVIELAFTALTNGQLSEALDITSDVTDAQVYTTEKEVVNLELEINSTAQEGVEFALYQNEPNPFAGTTQIPFYINTASDVSLEVYNAEGKVLYRQTMAAAKGNNAFELNSDELNNHGVLFYRVETRAMSAIKKMIVLK